MLEPLTPPDCDLRDFAYMPLDVVRLRDSETAVLLNAAEFRAAILLWCAAWHQVPAASLPNDDRLLAGLAGYGRDRRGWNAVKAGALRGFILCADERFYHPVISEKAAEAFAKCRSQRKRTAAATKAAAARAAEKRNENNETPIRNGPVTDSVTEPSRSSVTDTKGREGKGIERNGGGVVAAKAEIALIAGALFKQFSDVFAGKVGRGAKAKFIGLLGSGQNADPIIAAAKSVAPTTDAEQWLDARGWEPVKATPACTISPEAMALGDELAKIAGQNLDFLEPGWGGAAYRAQQWLSQGWPRELIVAGITSMVNAKRGERINNIAYFEKGLARFIAQHTRPVPTVTILPAEQVEVRHEAVDRRNAHSGFAAIDRVFDAIEAKRTEHESLHEDVVLSLPARSVR